MNKDEMIEKVAGFIYEERRRVSAFSMTPWSELSLDSKRAWLGDAEAALDALGLLDGSSWIAPWEASEAMLDAVSEIDPKKWRLEDDYAAWRDAALSADYAAWRDAAMRDAALSAPEST